MDSPGENNMLLWSYSTLVRRSNQFFVWDGTRYLLWVLPDTRGRLLYDVWHSSKTPLPDTVVRHFWKTLTNDASSFGGRNDQTKLCSPQACSAILCYTAIICYPWICLDPSKWPHWQCASGGLAKKCETVKQVSMLKAGCSESSMWFLPVWQTSKRP